jgi:hypothetical protein
MAKGEEGQAGREGEQEGVYIDHWIVSEMSDRGTLEAILIVLRNLN